MSLIYRRTTLVCLLAATLGGAGDVAAQAQDGAIQDRPWLEGLPIQEQSLTIPTPREPDLSRRCAPAQALAGHLKPDPGAGPYSDPRYVGWLHLYHACKHDQLLASLEDDLRSGQPHPQAAAFWSALRNGRGELEEGWRSRHDAALVSALGMVPDLVRAQFGASDIANLNVLRRLSPEQRIRDAVTRSLVMTLNGEALADPALDDKPGLLLAAPDWFQSWWPTQWRNRADREQLAMLIAPGGPLADHVFAPFARDYILADRLTANDQLAITEAWLAHFPNDAKAYWMRGNAYEALEQPEKAAAAFFLSDLLEPFHPGINAGQAYLAGDDAMGDAMVSRVQAFYADPAKIEQIYDYSRRNAGFGHEARTRLLTAHERFPQDINILRSLNTLEARAERTSQALEYARKAWLMDDADWDDASALMAALREDGLAREALSVFEQAQSRFGQPDADLVIAAADAAKAAGRREQEEALLRMGLTQPIDTPRIRRRLIDFLLRENRPDEVVAQSRVLLAERWGYSTDFNDFYDAAAQIANVKGVEEALAWSRANAGNKADAIMSAIRKLRSLGASDRAEEVRLEAENLYADRFWPIYLREPEKTDRAAQDAFIAAVDARWDKFSPSDREWAIRNLASVVKDGVAGGVQPRARFKDIEPRFREMLPMMSRSSAAWSGFNLYLGLGDGKSFMDLWTAAADANPYDFDPYRPFRDNVEGLDRTPVFQQIWKRLTRDRYRKGQLDDFMEINSRWGGSPILSACLGQWAERNYPEAMPQIAAEIRGARDRLGEHAQSFRKQYSSGTQVSASERYIDWYHNSKKQAQGEEKIVDLDCERGIATTVDDDGTIAVEQKDYRTGKLLLVAEGRAWVRYRYNEAGLVTSLSSSNGRSVALHYDDRGKIERLDDKETGELRFQYNDAGKPVRIEAAGMGTLTIDYGLDNEVASVKAVDTKGDGSQMIAMRITRAFQNLLGLTKPERAKEIIQDTSEAFRNALDPDDLNLDGSASVERTTTLMNVARVHGDTGRKAMQVVDSEVAEIIASPQLAAVSTRTFTAFGEAFHRLYAQVSPFGMAQNRWEMWLDYLRLAERRSGEKPVAALLARLHAAPLKPMRPQEWQVTAPLRNPGYWYVDDAGDLIARSLRSNLQFTAMVVRGNGDTVAASSAGLLVRRAGNWQRYRFDGESGRWLQDAFRGVDGGPIVVTALADLPDGRLLIGTNRGLYLLDEDYEQVLARAATPADGLPAAMIRDIALHGDRIAVATSGGLVELVAGPDGLAPAGSLLLAGDTPFVSPGPDNTLLSANETGLFVIGEDNARRIARNPVTDAAWSEGDGRILALERGSLYSSLQRGEDYSPLVPVVTAGSAGIERVAHGFARFTLEGGDPMIAVLGDRGYAIWHGSYFEYLPLAGAAARPGAVALGAGKDTLAIAGGDGAIYRFSPSETQIVSRSAFKASAYDARADLAYFTDGSRIMAALPAKAGENPVLRTFGRANGEHLALDADGNLIAVDGNQIVRFAADGSGSAFLFEADPFCPEREKCQTRIEALLVASDGAIWVTAGPSAWRYAGGSAKEYNYYRDPQTFPVATNWLSGLVELADGSIVISASQEGHLTYKGNTLSGQNLVWRDGGFKPFDNSALFLSATEVDGVEIIGSTRGFFERDETVLTDLGKSEDESYAKLRARYPNLYLAGKGARIGDSTWLFPTPAGIVGYQDGAWFYPERLNWQFTDAAKADLGYRHTNAVEVDKAGRIYAATDHGLLVMQARGGDATEFLVANGRSDLAFATVERRKLRREAQALLDGIDRKDPKYARLNQVLAAQEDVARLRSTVLSGGGGLSATPQDKGTAAGGKDIVPGSSRPVAAEGLRERLESKENEYRRLLAVLEREQPDLASLLTIRPLELTALQGRIPKDSVLVQYIPQPGKLLIHVIARDRHEIRTVEIPREDLMASAMAAHAFLKESVITMESRARRQASVMSGGAQAPMPTDTPQGHLAALYEYLLAPVETDIDGFKRVYISAAGALNYVPFSALTRVRDGKRQYAIERYTLGMIPTAFLLERVLGDRSLSASSALVMGNPDGSLAYAEREASNVGELLKSRIASIELRTGANAGRQSLEQYGRDARLLHLATHGKLTARPEDSYLVLAGGERLSTIDIMGMDFQEVQMAFLSACETARGDQGLEYATLARAFSFAGVPTTIASLWSVGDKATYDLVDRFYQSYSGDSMLALAQAQRKMIEGWGALRHPSAWAAFQTFGRGWEK